jgi:hypothetical protein
VLLLFVKLDPRAKSFRPDCNNNNIYNIKIISIVIFII